MASHQERMVSRRRKQDRLREHAAREAQQKVGSRIESLEAENQSLRDALFAVLKTMGRVRVPKEVVASLAPGDSMGVREEGAFWVFTYEPTPMVVPGGVKDGQAAQEAG